MIRASEEGAFMLSAHAATRMAQRGIRSASLDLVLLHGVPSKAPYDCETYLLPDQAARQLMAAGYDEDVIKAAAKLKAIVGYDGTVVTCYYGRRRRLASLLQKERSRYSRQ